MTDLDTIDLVPDDFETTPWQGVLETLGDVEHYDRANAFYERALEAKKNGTVRMEAVFRLLGDLCSFHLRSDHPAQPFRAWMMLETFQSASPDSISRARIEVLRSVAPSVQDPWLRARIADFVWSFGRGYPMARLAVGAYLELAGELGEDPDDPWSDRVRALERALEIAAPLGPKSEPFAQVSAFLTSVLEQTDATQGLLAHRLLALAGQYRIGDPLSLHHTAEHAAEHAEGEGDWIRAEQYWLDAEELAIVAKDEERRHRAQVRIAETYVSRALAVADQPHIGRITAAAQLQRAVEALRRAGGMQKRIEEVMRLMMEYQRDIPGALIPISSSIPIGDAVEEARKAVTGKSLEAALLAFALYPPLPNYTDLRREAEEGAKQYMLRSLFPAVQLNADGKVVARQGSLDARDPLEREAALRVEMVQRATTYYGIVAPAAIIPARRCIMDEHPLRVDDFFWIVANNPLVPPGRELLYAEAFYAGFTGDLPKAIHILVHQVEHSVRELLKRYGVIVTGLSRDGIQMERNLNALLYEDLLGELIGHDIVFALQSLLVEKFGPDLRNRVAHGLMGHAEFHAHACSYYWWLCFRLACLPIINAIHARETAPAQQTPPEGRNVAGDERRDQD